jgi:hypothetical protein
MDYLPCGFDSSLLLVVLLSLRHRSLRPERGLLEVGPDQRHLATAGASSYRLYLAQELGEEHRELRRLLYSQVVEQVNRELVADHIVTIIAIIVTRTMSTASRNVSSLDNVVPGVCRKLRGFVVGHVAEPMNSDDGKETSDSSN